MDGDTQLSKRDKRRQKDARKKAEEEARKEEMKQARKEAKKQGLPSRPTAQIPEAQDDGFQKVQAKRGPKSSQGGPKGKGKKQPLEEEVTEEKLQRTLDSIQEKRAKLVERWGEAWTGEPKRELLIPRLM